MYWWIVGCSILSGMLATAASGLILAFPHEARRSALPPLLSFATGTLLGAAFLEMIPKALSQADAGDISRATLAGIIGFFALEKLVLWRHCHAGDCQVHGRKGTLILVGDAFHNFVDGAVIAAAFLTSIPLGVTVTLAVIAHEVPQEIGDFAILLDSGFRPVQALLLNVLSASTALPGGILAYFWLAEMKEAMPYVLALSAASFIYVAMADLVPELHRQVAPAAAVRQVALVLAGIGAIWAVG